MKQGERKGRGGEGRAKKRGRGKGGERDNLLRITKLVKGRARVLAVLCDSKAKALTPEKLNVLSFKPKCFGEGKKSL